MPAYLFMYHPKRIRIALYTEENVNAECYTERVVNINKLRIEGCRRESIWTHFKLINSQKLDVRRSGDLKISREKNINNERAIIRLNDKWIKPYFPRFHTLNYLSQIFIGTRNCRIQAFGGRTSNCDQDQDSLLVKRRNDNHSPGPVIRELVPSSHQKSELSNTMGERSIVVCTEIKKMPRDGWRNCFD